jgi:hypothetical protein
MEPFLELKLYYNPPIHTPGSIFYLPEKNPTIDYDKKQTVFKLIPLTVVDSVSVKVHKKYLKDINFNGQPETDQGLVVGYIYERSFDSVRHGLFKGISNYSFNGSDYHIDISRIMKYAEQGLFHVVLTWNKDLTGTLDYIWINDLPVKNNGLVTVT